MLVGGSCMALLRASASALLATTPFTSVVEDMIARMLAATGRRPEAAEQRSWARSIPTVLCDLHDAGLGNVEVLLEHQLPLTSKRVDVILAGYHPVTGHPSFVVLELKQWSNAHAYEDSRDLVLVDGYTIRPLQHPAQQVAGYVDYLVDFTPALDDQSTSVVGAAYLHNATDQSVADLFNRPVDTRSRFFTGQRRQDFLTFLTQHLAIDTPSVPAADLLLHAATAPSKQLLSVAAAQIQQREQFILLDEQRIAYDLVLHAVEQARGADSKSIIVVSGGPGSGKSVIALSLLGELARRGRTVIHATGSRSFTQTLRKVAGHGSSRTQKLFRYFNSFMSAERNSLDVLILDEAHRIRETSENRYTKAELRKGRPQIDELIAVARVPVFLLDEHQVVKPGELGSVRDIQDYAKGMGLPVHHIDLHDQFRCGGSESYARWVLRLLDLEPGGAIPWTGDDHFEVRVADTPQELAYAMESARDAGYTARISAGYCWPWSDPNTDGSLVDDVVIGDWRRPWNLKGDRSIGGAPPSALWASDPAGFNQVGCIYTAQGFEYDWSGVIIGPDLIHRDGRWETVRAGNRDPDFRNPQRVPDLEFDRLIRNVYKVLLTRGMIGTVLYSYDAQTRDFLRSLIESPRP